MFFRTVPEPAEKSLAPPGAPAAKVIAALGLSSLLLCSSVVSQPAEAAPKLCGDRDQILEGSGRCTTRPRKRSAFPVTAG
jgi:hypothetical protein